MLKQRLFFSIVLISIPAIVPAQSKTADNRIRVIVIGAHPDDEAIKKLFPMLGK